MYANAYQNMKKLSDRIREGEYESKSKKERTGLIRRPEMREKKEDTSQDQQRRIMEYMNIIRMQNQELGSEMPLRDAESAAEEPSRGSGGDPTGDVSGEGPEGVPTLMALIDKTEGAGSYTTLFNHAQKDDFAGVDITQMTIGELKDFANGEYGEWSKEQLGYKATPMGRYQIVGTTLASAAKEMGLDDDTVFSPEVQDEMFIHLAKNNINNLRGTWEGLKNVSEEELEQAREELRNL